MAEENRSLDVVTLITAGRDREAAQRGAGLVDPITTPNPPPGGPMDPLAQFEELGHSLMPVVAGLDPADLGNATPCAGFTVRGVLEHMIGGGTMFTAAYRGEAPPEPDFTDPIGGARQMLLGLADAISSPGALDRTIQAPFGEVDGATFARFVVLDGLVHGWDMAVATGQPYTPSDELVAAVQAFAEQAIDPMRDGDTFGDAVEPPAGATPIERLAAFTGRRPLATAP